VEALKQASVSCDVSSSGEARALGDQIDDQGKKSLPSGIIGLQQMTLLLGDNMRHVHVVIQVINDSGKTRMARGLLDSGCSNCSKSTVLKKIVTQERLKKGTIVHRVN